MTETTTTTETEAVLLSVAQAGELLGLNARQVRELCWRRHLPHVKLGRHVRIPRAAIEALAEQAIAEHEAEADWR